MGMQLPAGLRKLFHGLTGSEWFTADEDKLRALADLLSRTGGRIETEIPPLITSVKRRVRTTFDSRAADYFDESIDKLTSGETNYVKAAADAAHQLGDFVREAANQVEYVKWMIIGQLIQLALEIAWAIAMAKWTFGASLTMIPVFERIASLAIQRLLNFLFNTLLTHLVVSVAFAMTMDQLIQRLQIARGNRKGNDGQLSTAAGVGGVLDGLFSAGFSWVGGKFADWVTDNFGDLLKNHFKIGPDPVPPPVGGRGPGSADAPGSGAPPPKSGGGVQTGDAPVPRGGRDDAATDGPRPKGDDAPVPTPKGSFDEPTPQPPPGGGVPTPPPPVRTPATVPQRLADDMADALARHSSDLARPFGRDPRPWDNAATAARFRDDAGRVFESNLGDQLGRDAARDLGRNYADTFIANWGTRDIGGSLARVLDDAPTGSGGRQLSPEIRDFLSRTVPEGTAKGLAEFADNWRRTAAHFGSNIAQGAGSNFLADGFSNMALSEDHEFKANGMSAVAGAANVGLTTGGVLGGIKGLDALENLFKSNMTVDAPSPPVTESDPAGASSGSEALTGGGSTGGSGGTGGSGSGGGAGGPGRANGPEDGEAPPEADAGPGTPDPESADLLDSADSPGNGNPPDTDEHARPAPPPDVPSRPEVPVPAGGDPAAEPPSGTDQDRTEIPRDAGDMDAVGDHPSGPPVVGGGFTGAPPATTGAPPAAPSGNGTGTSRPGSAPRGDGAPDSASRTQDTSGEAGAPPHPSDAQPVRTTSDTEVPSDPNGTDTRSGPERPVSDRGAESDPEGIGPEAADGPREDTAETLRESPPRTDPADLDEFGGLYDDPPTPSRTEAEPVDPEDPWQGNPPRELDLGALQDPKGGKGQPRTIQEVIADLTEYRYALDDVLPSSGTFVSVNLADRFHYRRSYGDDGFADYDEGSHGQDPADDDGGIFDFSPSTSPAPHEGSGYGGHSSRSAPGHPSAYQAPRNRAPVDDDWTLDDLDDQSSEDAFHHSDHSDEQNTVPVPPAPRHPLPRVPGIPTHNPFLSGPAGTGLPPVVGGLLEFRSLWGIGTTAPRVRTFADDAEAIRSGRDHWDAYVRDLPEREADAVRAYTAPGTYRQINTALRSGGRLDPETRQYIRRIDRALAGRPVPEDVMVTRGMGISHLPMSPQDMVDQGTRFHESGYLSTALGRPAPSFDNNEAVLYIRVPAGTPAIWMERLSTYGVQERELVLGRDLEWSAVDAVQRDGQWHMMVEIAPDSLPATGEDATASSRPEGSGGHRGSGHGRTGDDQHGGHAGSGGRAGQRTAPPGAGRAVRFNAPEEDSARPSATRSAAPAAARSATEATRTPVPEAAGAPEFGPPANHRPGDPAPRVADLPDPDRWGEESEPQVRRFSAPYADTLKLPAGAPPLTFEVNTESGPMRARVRIDNLFFESTTRRIHREGGEGPSSVRDVKLRILSLPGQQGMDRQAHDAAWRALKQRVEAEFNGRYVLPRGGQQLNVSVVQVTSGPPESVHAWVYWSPVPSAADGSPPPALGPEADGRGIGEVLRRLGMLDGDPARGGERPYVARRTLDRIEAMVEARPQRRWVDPQSTEPALAHTGLVDPSVWEGARAGVPVHQVGAHVSAEVADPGTGFRAARPLDTGPGGAPVDPATVVDNPDARPGDPKRFVGANMNPTLATRRFEWARIPIPEEHRTQGGPTHVLELTFRPRIHRDEDTVTPERYEAYVREYTAALDALWNRRFRIRGDGTVAGADGTRAHKLGEKLFNTLFGEGSRPDRDDMEAADSASGAQPSPPGSGDQLHIRLLLADDSTPDDQVHNEILLESRPGQGRGMDTDSWNEALPVEAGVHETAHLLGLLDEYVDASTVFRGDQGANAVRPGDDGHGYGLMGNEWLGAGADGQFHKHREPAVLNGYLDTIASVVEHGTADYTHSLPRAGELSDETKSDIAGILEPGLAENGPARFKVFDRFALAIDVFSRGWSADRAAEHLVTPGEAAGHGAVREQVRAAFEAEVEGWRADGRLARAMDLANLNGARVPASAVLEALPEATRRTLEDVLTDSNDLTHADALAVFAAGRDRAFGHGPFAGIPAAQGRPPITADDVEAQIDQWRSDDELIEALGVLADNGLTVRGGEWIGALEDGPLRDVARRLWSGADPDLGGPGLGQAGSVRVALEVFGAGFDQMVYRAPSRALTVTVPDGRRVRVSEQQVYDQLRAWRRQGTLADVLDALRDSGATVPDDVLARVRPKRGGQRTVPVGTGRPVRFDPPDDTSANPPATARSAPPPPPDHDDVLTVTFAKSDNALREDDRTAVREFAQRRTAEAYRALLHDTQLPATQVQGHGSRAGVSNTAESRGQEVSSEYTATIRRQNVHRIGLFADDLAPAVLDPSREQGGKGANRSAELRSVPPPVRRVVVGGPGGDGRQVPRVLHMNWFHGKVPEASEQNMRDWAARAAEAGWTVRLWTDGPANRRNRTLFRDLAGLPGADGRPAVEVSTSPAEDLGIRDGARDLHDFAAERELWPMQSDIVRYHALATHGGMHVDSDIGPGAIDLRRPLPPMGADSVPMLAPMLRDQGQEQQVHRQLQELGRLTGADASELPTPAQYQWRLGDFNNNLIVAPPGSRFLNEMISGLALTDEIRNAVPGPLPVLEGARAAQARGVPAQFSGPGRMRTSLVAHIAAQEDREIRENRRFAEFRKGNWTVDPRYADYLAGVAWVTEDSADYSKYVATESGSGSDSGGDPGRARSAQAPHGGRRAPARSLAAFTAASEAEAGPAAPGPATAGPGSPAGGAGGGGRVPRFLLRDPAPVRNDLPGFDPQEATGRSERMLSFPFAEEPDGPPSQMSVELGTSHGRMRADVRVHHPFFVFSAIEVPGGNGADSRYVRQIEVRLRVRATPDLASQGAASAASAVLKRRIESLFNGLYVLPRSGDQLHVSVEPAKSGLPYHADVVWHRVPPSADGVSPPAPGPDSADRGTRDLLRRLGLLDHDPARGRGEPFVARQTLERIENAAPTRDGLLDFNQHRERKRKQGDAEPNREGRWFSRDLADALKPPLDAPPLSVELDTGRGRMRAEVEFNTRYFLSTSVEAVRDEGEQGGPASFRHVLLRVRAAAGDGADEQSAVAATMKVKRHVESLFNRRYVLPRSGEQLHVSVVVLKADQPTEHAHATLTWSAVSPSGDGAQAHASSGAPGVRGIGEVLRRLGMLDGDPARGEDHPYVARRTLDRIETMARARPERRWADPQGEVALSDHEHKVVENPARWRGADRDEWEAARAAARVHQVGAHVSAERAEIRRSARAARPLGENDFDEHGDLKDPAGVVAEDTALGVPRFIPADMSPKWVGSRRFEHRRIPIPERYREKVGKDGPTHVREITFRVRPNRHPDMTQEQFDTYLEDYAKKLDAMFNGRFRLRGDGSLLNQNGVVVHRLGGDAFETLFGKDSVPDPKDLKGNEATVPGADPLPGTGDQLHVRLEFADDTTPSVDVHAAPTVRHYDDAAQSTDMPGMNMTDWHDGYPVEAAVHETGHWLGLVDEYPDARSVFRWREDADAVRVDGGLMANDWLKFSGGRVRKTQDPFLRTRYADTIASVVDHGTSDHAAPRWAQMRDRDKSRIARILEPGLAKNDPARFEVFDRFALAIDRLLRGWDTDRIADQFLSPQDATARGAVREQVGVAADARAAARREAAQATEARAAGEDARARAAEARAAEFAKVAGAADARAAEARKHAADSGADTRAAKVRTGFEAEVRDWQADGRLLRALDLVREAADQFNARVPAMALVEALPPGEARTLAHGLSGSSDPVDGFRALNIFAAGRDRAFGPGPFTDIPADQGRPAVSAGDIEAQLAQWRGRNHLVTGLRVFHDHGVRVWGREWAGALPDAGRAAVVAALLPAGGPRQGSVLDGLGPLPRPVLERVVLDIVGAKYDQSYNNQPLRNIKAALPGHPDILLTKEQVSSQVNEWNTEGVLASAEKQLSQWRVPMRKPGPGSAAPASAAPPSRQQAAPGGTGAPAPFTAVPRDRPAEFVPARQTEGADGEQRNPETAFASPADLPESVAEPADAAAELNRSYLDPEPVVGDSDPRRFVPLGPEVFAAATESAEAAPGTSVREQAGAAPQEASASAPAPTHTSERTSPPAADPSPSLADSWGGVLNPASRPSGDGQGRGDDRHPAAPAENGADPVRAQEVAEQAESLLAEGAPPVVADPGPGREGADAGHERELARARRGKRPDPAAAERAEAADAAARELDEPAAERPTGTESDGARTGRPDLDAHTVRAPGDPRDTGGTDGRAPSGGPIPQSPAGPSRDAGPVPLGGTNRDIPLGPLSTGSPAGQEGTPPEGAPPPRPIPPLVYDGSLVPDRRGQSYDLGYLATSNLLGPHMLFAEHLDGFVDEVLSTTPNMPGPVRREIVDRVAGILGKEGPRPFLREGGQTVSTTHNGQTWSVDIDLSPDDGDFYRVDTTALSGGDARFLRLHDTGPGVASSDGGSRGAGKTFGVKFTMSPFYVTGVNGNDAGPIAAVGGRGGTKVRGTSGSASTSANAASGIEQLGAPTLYVGDLRMRMSVTGPGLTAPRVREGTAYNGLAMNLPGEVVSAPDAAPRRIVPDNGPVDANGHHPAVNRPFMGTGHPIEVTRFSPVPPPPVTAPGSGDRPGRSTLGTWLADRILGPRPRGEHNGDRASSGREPRDNGYRERIEHTFDNERVQQYLPQMSNSPAHILIQVPGRSPVTMAMWSVATEYSRKDFSPSLVDLLHSNTTVKSNSSSVKQSTVVSGSIGGGFGIWLVLSNGKSIRLEAPSLEYSGTFEKSTGVTLNTSGTSSHVVRAPSGHAAYDVRRDFYVHIGGEPGPHRFEGNSIELLTVEDARLLNGEPPKVPGPDGGPSTPPRPPFPNLAVDRPTNLSGAIVRGFGHAPPDDGGTTGTAGDTQTRPSPQDPFYRDLAYRVLRAISEVHPGMVIPDLARTSENYALRPSHMDTDGSTRSPREYRGLRRNMKVAQQNTLKVLNALSESGLKNGASDLPGNGVPVRLKESAVIDPKTIREDGGGRPEAVTVRVYGDFGRLVHRHETTASGGARFAGSAGITTTKGSSFNHALSLTAGASVRTDAGADARGVPRVMGNPSVSFNGSLNRSKGSSQGLSHSSEETVLFNVDSDEWASRVRFTARLFEHDDVGMARDDRPQREHGIPLLGDGMEAEAFLLTPKMPPVASDSPNTSGDTAPATTVGWRSLTPEQAQDMIVRNFVPQIAPDGTAGDDRGGRWTVIRGEFVRRWGRLFSGGAENAPLPQNTTGTDNDQAVVLTTPPPPDGTTNTGTRPQAAPTGDDRDGESAPDDRPPQGPPTLGQARARAIRRIGGTTERVNTHFDTGSRGTRGLLEETYRTFSDTRSGLHDGYRRKLESFLAHSSGGGRQFENHLSGEELAASKSVTTPSGSRIRQEMSGGFWSPHDVRATVATKVEIDTVTDFRPVDAQMRWNGGSEVTLSFTSSPWARSLGFRAGGSGVRNPNPYPSDGSLPNEAVRPIPGFGPFLSGTSFFGGTSHIQAISFTSSVLFIPNNTKVYAFRASGHLTQAIEFQKNWSIGPPLNWKTLFHGWTAPVEDLLAGYVHSRDVQQEGLVMDRATRGESGTRVNLSPQSNPKTPDTAQVRPGFEDNGRQLQPADPEAAIQDLVNDLAGNGLELTSGSRELLLQKLTTHLGQNPDSTVPVPVKVRVLGPEPTSDSHPHAMRWATAAKVYVNLTRDPSRTEVSYVGQSGYYIESHTWKATDANSRSRGSGTAVGADGTLLGPLPYAKDDQGSDEQPDSRPLFAAPAGAVSASSNDRRSHGRSQDDARTVELHLNTPYAKVGADTRLTLTLELGEPKGGKNGNPPRSTYTGTADSGRVEILYPFAYMTFDPPATSTVGDGTRSTGTDLSAPPPAIITSTEGTGSPGPAPADRNTPPALEDGDTTRRSAAPVHASVSEALRAWTNDADPRTGNDTVVTKPAMVENGGQALRDKANVVIARSLGWQPPPGTPEGGQPTRATADKARLYLVKAYDQDPVYNEIDHSLSDQALKAVYPSASRSPEGVQFTDISRTGWGAKVVPSSRGARILDALPGSQLSDSRVQPRTHSFGDSHGGGRERSGEVRPSGLTTGDVNDHDSHEGIHTGAAGVNTSSSHGTERESNQAVKGYQESDQLRQGTAYLVEHDTTWAFAAGSKLKVPSAFRPNVPKPPSTPFYSPPTRWSVDSVTVRMASWYSEADAVAMGFLTPDQVKGLAPVMDRVNQAREEFSKAEAEYADTRAPLEGLAGRYAAAPGDRSAESAYEAQEEAYHKALSAFDDQIDALIETVNNTRTTLGGTGQGTDEGTVPPARAVHGGGSGGAAARASATGGPQPSVPGTSPDPAPAPSGPRRELADRFGSELNLRPSESVAPGRGPGALDPDGSETAPGSQERNTNTVDARVERASEAAGAALQKARRARDDANGLSTTLERGRADLRNGIRILTGASDEAPAAGAGGRAGPAPGTEGAPSPGADDLRGAADAAHGVATTARDAFSAADNEALARAPGPVPEAFVERVEATVSDADALATEARAAAGEHEGTVGGLRGELDGALARFRALETAVEGLPGRARTVGGNRAAQEARDQTNSLISELEGIAARAGAAREAADAAATKAEAAKTKSDTAKTTADRMAADAEALRTWAEEFSTNASGHRERANRAAQDAREAGEAAQRASEAARTARAAASAAAARAAEVRGGAADATREAALDAEAGARTARTAADRAARAAENASRPSRSGQAVPDGTGSRRTANPSDRAPGGTGAQTAPNTAEDRARAGNSREDAARRGAEDARARAQEARQTAREAGERATRAAEEARQLDEQAQNLRTRAATTVREAEGAATRAAEARRIAEQARDAADTAVEDADKAAADARRARQLAQRAVRRAGAALTRAAAAVETAQEARDGAGVIADTARNHVEGVRELLQGIAAAADAGRTPSDSDASDSDDSGNNRKKDEDGSRDKDGSGGSGGRSGEGGGSSDSRPGPEGDGRNRRRGGEEDHSSHGGGQGGRGARDSAPSDQRDTDSVPDPMAPPPHHDVVELFSTALNPSPAARAPRTRRTGPADDRTPEDDRAPE